MGTQLAKRSLSPYGGGCRGDVYAYEFAVDEFIDDLGGVWNGLKQGRVSITKKFEESRLTLWINSPISVQVGQPVVHDYGDSTRVAINLPGGGFEYVSAPDTTRRQLPRSSYSYPSGPKGLPYEKYNY